MGMMTSGHTAPQKPPHVVQGTYAESSWQLQVKLLEGAASGPSVASFLGRAVEPPVEAAVKNALRLLEDIGAIQEGTEALTKLGRHLAALPLPPRVGKMLLFGVMFGCLDPVLTVACCMAYRLATHSCVHPESNQVFPSFVPVFLCSLCSWF